MSLRENLEKLVGTPRDGAPLRFSLGNECLKDGDAAAAVQHLRAAVDYDAQYSAAWKLLGKALTAAGDNAAALLAFQQGILVAKARGDVQAAKEMQVFARRLERAAAAPGGDTPEEDR